VGISKRAGLDSSRALLASPGFLGSRLPSFPNPDPEKPVTYIFLDVWCSSPKPFPYVYSPSSAVSRPTARSSHCCGLSRRWRGSSRRERSPPGNSTRRKNPPPQGLDKRRMKMQHYCKHAGTPPGVRRDCILGALSPSVLLRAPIPMPYNLTLGQKKKKCPLQRHAQARAPLVETSGLDRTYILFFYAQVLRPPATGCAAKVAQLPVRGNCGNPTGTDCREMHRIVFLAERPGPGPEILEKMLRD